MPQASVGSASLLLDLKRVELFDHPLFCREDIHAAKLRTLYEQCVRRRCASSHLFGHAL